LTVRVQITPSSSTSPLPSCSLSFVDDLQDNLTALVLNATQAISSLSDFIIPSGLHLTYFDNRTSVRRALKTRASTKKIDPCKTCTSSGCALTCGLGVCDLCQSSRRTLEAITPSDSTFHIDPQRRRLGNANWNKVGKAVTGHISPLFQQYLLSNSAESKGCLGNPTQLAVSVTYLSDVPVDSTLETELVLAFGAPSSPPTPVAAPSPNACCSQSFATCVNYCGTTRQQCSTCSDTTVEWLPQGPPANANTCIPRWSACTDDVEGCCDGLSCVGDQYWRGCLYVPPGPPTPTSAPTSIPTGCCTQSFATCVSYCGVTEKQCQTCADQTVVWLPQGLPSNANTCIPRWSACTNDVNGCCSGLTCTGNEYWKGCEYNATSSS
jgi:hypothetical protein